MDIRRKPPNPKVRVDNLEYAIPHEESAAKNVLEEIVWHKDTEIKQFKNSLPLEELISKIDTLPPTKGFINGLQDSRLKFGIIAEIKKASPSKGVIREDFYPENIAISYERAGAACISVLTDKKFFQGGFEILADVRKVSTLPLLCKDFIISAYQIYKARISGADAVLLIAAILEDSDLRYLKKIADKLNMDVLVEVHNDKELERVLKLKCFNLIGINNRNLKTFTTDIDITLNLASSHSNFSLNKEIVFISESGINNTEDLKRLQSVGIKGALIGEKLMREDDIELGFKNLINSF
tara:strand:- start:52 stop:939 length:888 start_codon:yes stop_codon:yes gene_type:complete